MGDNCPKTCKHKTFHFCMESGTHCDKHCVCVCRLCIQEMALKAKNEKKISKRSLSEQKEFMPPSSWMTPAQKAVCYPGPDMPNPPSEPE